MCKRLKKMIFLTLVTLTSVFLIENSKNYAITNYSDLNYAGIDVSNWQGYINYEEVKNDSIRYRGAYRHSLFALKHLVKYGFTPVVTVVNYYNLSDDEIYREYLKVFAKYNLNLKPANIQIVPYYDKNQDSETIHCSNIPDKLDCIHGRTLTSSGIYTCPFLANDYRGRCGSSFSDYNKRSSLETNFCNTCLNSSNAIFAIDFTKLM